MNEERLKAIEARLNATTPGTWINYEHDGGWAGICAHAAPDDPRGDELVIGRTESEDVGVMEAEDNAAFIADAPIYVRDLVAEVRRLRELLREARPHVARRSLADANLLLRIDAALAEDGR